MAVLSHPSVLRDMFGEAMVNMDLEREVCAAACAPFDTLYELHAIPPPHQTCRAVSQERAMHSSLSDEVLGGEVPCPSPIGARAGVRCQQG